jgi:hypothetical protein
MQEKSAPDICIPSLLKMYAATSFTMLRERAGLLLLHLPTVRVFDRQVGLKSFRFFRKKRKCKSEGFEG